MTTETHAAVITRAPSTKVNIVTPVPARFGGRIGPDDMPSPALPHIVAISPTFPEIAVSPSEFAKTWDVFGPLIDERLWPNPKYRWLSGILEHNTHRVAPPSELSYFVGYTPNPNATVPVPETMDRALKGEAEFHLMWQRPRRPEAGPLPTENSA